MILTNQKIVVTHEMMAEHGLSAATERGPMYAVPKGNDVLKDGVTWKGAMNLEEEDFDKIEEFFLHNKQA